MPGPEKLLVLDTPSLYFRAFYGVPESVTAPDGTPVNAVRGLLDFIARLVGDLKPTRLVAAMDDDWRPAWRVAALPSYKAHRVTGSGGDQTPDALAVQVPVIEDVLAALGLCRLGLPDYEADDIIGTLATTAPCPVDIVTGDRDLFQLVDDAKPVRIIYTAKGVGRATPWNEAEVAAKYGIPGRAYADFALLRGDPSDGLPGAAGIGEKTAAALITRYGSIAATLAAAADETTAMRADIRRKLLASLDYLVAAGPVVRVVCDLDIPPLNDRLPSSPADPAAVVTLADALALDASFNRVLVALAGATSA